jgi:hypothetical protein
VKIGELHHVGIYDCQAANSRASEGRDYSASDAPGADNRDTGRLQLALADPSDLRIVRLGLTANGRRVLAELSAVHLAELERLAETIAPIAREHGRSGRSG